MSLLQQDSTELDDAARGEELTRGTSHVVIAAIIATVVVAAAIAIYVIAGQKPPIATGEIVAVWAHPQHTETSGLDASGAPMPKEVVDQVMVFTQVRLQNQTDHPLYLSNVLTNVTLDDGIHSSYAANKGDYDRVFVAYPDIPVPHNTPISPLDTDDRPRPNRRRNLRFGFQDDKTAVGRAQEAGLHLQFPVSAQPGARAPGGDY